MKNEKKRDCKNCTFCKLFDKVFEPEIKNKWHGLSFGGGSDEEYELHHMCGLCEHIEYCDIPGFRSSDKWYDQDKCILKLLNKDTSDKWPFPVYDTTKYDDLFKH